MTSNVDVTLVTYEDGPEISADDALLVDALHRRGLTTRAAVWSDPSVDWVRSRVTIIRSSWDYFHRPDEFTAWLAAIDQLTRVINPAETLLWNMDKRYLQELEAGGLRIVPTIFAEEADAELAGRRLASTDVVIKPTISGAAFGTRRFDLKSDLAAASDHLAAMIRRGGAMVQPYLPAVAGEGERSLVFLAGQFSHAYVKRPFGGMAGTDSRPTIPHEPTSDEIAFAFSVLKTSGKVVHYARVDIIPDVAGPMLMELELIEPALFFSVRAESADLLAGEIAALVAKPGAPEGPLIDGDQRPVNLAQVA